HSAGCVLVPLNTRLKGTEAAYILEKSGAKILCTMDEFLGARYVDMLREAEPASPGGSGRRGPVPALPNLEQIVLLRTTGDSAGGGADRFSDWQSFLAR